MNQYMPELGRFYSDSNPEVWVFQAERYFNFYGFSKDSWLSMPYVYFKGEARAWFDWLYRNDQFYDWNHFTKKLVMHYSNRTFTDRMGHTDGSSDSHSVFTRPTYSFSPTALKTHMAVENTMKNHSMKTEAQVFDKMSHTFSADMCDLDEANDGAKVAETPHSCCSKVFDSKKSDTEFLSFDMKSDLEDRTLQYVTDDTREKVVVASPQSMIVGISQASHDHQNSKTDESLKEVACLVPQLMPEPLEDPPLGDDLEVPSSVVINVQHHPFMSISPTSEVFTNLVFPREVLTFETLSHSVTATYNKNISKMALPKHVQQGEFTVPNENVGWIDTGQTSSLKPSLGIIHCRLKYFDGQDCLVLPECPPQDLSARKVIHYEGTHPIWMNMVMQVQLIDDSVTLYPFKDCSAVCRDNLKEIFKKFEHHIDTILPAHSVLNQFPFNPGDTLLLVTPGGYKNSFANEIDGLGIIGVFLTATRVGSTDLPIEGLAPSCFGLHLTTHDFTLVQAMEKDVFDTSQPKCFGALLFCQMSVNRSKNRYEVFCRSMFHVTPGGWTLVICVWDPGISMTDVTDPWLSVPKYSVMAGNKSCSLFANEVTISAIFLKEINSDIDLELVLVEHLTSHSAIACGQLLSIGFVVDYCYNAFKGPSIAREELILTLLQFPHVQFRSDFPFDHGTSLLNFAQGISLVNGLPASRRSPRAIISHVSYIGLRIGPKSLPARIDFCGPCFQKHMQNLVYLCKCRDPPAVVECWELVNKFHDHPKTNFVNHIIDSLFNFAQQRCEFGPGVFLAWTGWQSFQRPVGEFRVPVKANHNLFKFMPLRRFANGMLALVFSYVLLVTTLRSWKLRSRQYKIGRLASVIAHIGLPTMVEVWIIDSYIPSQGGPTGILLNLCVAVEQVMHFLKLVILLMFIESINDQGFNWFITGALGTLKGPSILFLALIVRVRVVAKGQIIPEVRGAPSRIGFAIYSTFDPGGVQIVMVIKNIAVGIVTTGPGTVGLSVAHDTNIKGAYHMHYKMTDQVIAKSMPQVWSISF